MFPDRQKDEARGQFSGLVLHNKIDSILRGDKSFSIHKQYCLCNTMKLLQAMIRQPAVPSQMCGLTHQQRASSSALLQLLEKRSRLAYSNTGLHAHHWYFATYACTKVLAIESPCATDFMASKLSRPHEAIEGRAAYPEVTHSFFER